VKHGTTVTLNWLWSLSIIRYLAAGGIATLIGLYIQKMLVGTADLPASNAAVFMAQYVPSTALYYWLLRKLVFQGEHHKAARSFPRLVAVKVLHLGAAYLLYRWVLGWGWYYLLALLAAGAPLAPVFYLVTKHIVFPREEAEKVKA
jgi:putative flippase GtrA